MNMEGREFQPKAVEAVRKADVALIDRLLKSVIPDANFDGASVSWVGGEGKADALPVEYSLSSDTLAAVRRIAETPGTEDLVATIVLRPLQKKLSAPSNPQPAIVTKLGFFLNRIPGERKTLAAMSLQKEFANVARERKIAASKKSQALRSAPVSVPERETSEQRHRRETAQREDIAFLLGRYQERWAAVAPIDPSLFKNVPDSMKRWAADEVVRIRETFQDDKNGEHVVRGDALEAFAGIEIPKQRWIEAKVVRVSTLDDYANGVDLVFEFARDPVTGFVPRCAVDLGSTGTPEGARSKLSKGGKGAEVRFFKSEVEKIGEDGVEMQLRDIPMIILGVNATILAELGAAARRGEELGPDHPLKAVFLRQAEIQVGLQIQKLAADFVRVAIDNMPSERATLGAVNACANGVRTDLDFFRDVSRIRDILRGVPFEGLVHYLGPREATRFRHLLAIHASLSDQISAVDETHPDARRISETTTLSRSLQARSQPQPPLAKISPAGEIFLFAGADSATLMSD